MGILIMDLLDEIIAGLVALYGLQDEGATHGVAHHQRSYSNLELDRLIYIYVIMYV